MRAEAFEVETEECLEVAAEQEQAQVDRLTAEYELRKNEERLHELSQLKRSSLSLSLNSNLSTTLPDPEPLLLGPPTTDPAGGVAAHTSAESVLDNSKPHHTHHISFEATAHAPLPSPKGPSPPLAKSEHTRANSEHTQTKCERTQTKCEHTHAQPESPEASPATPKHVHAAAPAAAAPAAAAAAAASQHTGHTRRVGAHPPSPSRFKDPAAQVLPPSAGAIDTGKHVKAVGGSDTQLMSPQGPARAREGVELGSPQVAARAREGAELGSPQGGVHGGEGAPLASPRGREGRARDKAQLASPRGRAGQGTDGAQLASPRGTRHTRNGAQVASPRGREGRGTPTTHGHAELQRQPKLTEVEVAKRDGVKRSASATHAAPAGALDPASAHAQVCV